MIPKKIQEEINRAINLKSRAKALEQEAKDLTSTAKEILLPIMSAYEVDKCTLEGVGSVFIKHGRGSSIDATKLRESLLVYGHTIDEMESIMSSATKSWTTEYIEFKREK